MKKIVMFFITMLVFSTAQANYCDTRGPQCWRNAAESNIGSVQYTFRQIMATPVNDQYKQELRRDQQRWDNEINTKCQNNRCVAENGAMRHNYLLKELREIQQLMREAKNGK